MVNITPCVYCKTFSRSTIQDFDDFCNEIKNYINSKLDERTVIVQLCMPSEYSAVLYFKEVE